VVVLYRPDAAHDWEWVPQSREGLWSIGYIYVNDLQPGQYTLAVWDTQIVGINTNSHNEGLRQLNVFPNPASSTVAISWDEPMKGKLLVTDQQGRLQQQLDFADTNKIELKTTEWAKGLYLVEQQNLSGKTMAISKIVLQ